MVQQACANRALDDRADDCAAQTVLPPPPPPHLQAEGVEECHMYIVQEFCDGGSLFSAIERKRFWTPVPGSRHPLPNNMLHIICVAVNIAAGMAYLWVAALGCLRTCFGHPQPADFLRCALQ